MRLTIRPIGPDWPGGQRTKARDRRSSPFQRPSKWGAGEMIRAGGEVTWPETLTLLEREVAALRADAVVIQIDVSESDLRLDGGIRSSARPPDPAVIISFDSKYGPLRYYCDRFTTWQANARAIALGLEALRKVDRYGITKRGEQYSGWAALPPSSGAVAGIRQRFGGPAHAATWMLTTAKVGDANSIDRLIAVMMADKSYRDDIFKRAAKIVHPDAGGDSSEWETLVEARRVLESAS